MATAPNAKPPVDYPDSPVLEPSRPDDAVPPTQEVPPLTVEEIIGTGQVATGAPVVPVTPEAKSKKKVSIVSFAHKRLIANRRPLPMPLLALLAK